MTRRPARELRTERFELDSGETLIDLVQTYHFDGDPGPGRDDVTLVFHALTGSSDAVGGWARPLALPGGALDPERGAVLCVNLLGSCYGTRWISSSGTGPPRITTRDMARAVRLVVDHLGLGSIALATGGSLGGMVALEWAVSDLRLTRHTVVLAAPAFHSAAAIGWNAIQRSAIETAGAAGLALARQIAMMTYRTGAEFGERFGRELLDGRFQVERYLRHHGEKLAGRFDASSYLSLLDSMDSHDVGRGRGGIEAALAGRGGAITAVGIPGDLLYPAPEVASWASLAGAQYREIHSIHGHDAFLIETGQVNSILADALAAVSLTTNSSGGSHG